MTFQSSALTKSVVKKAVRIPARLSALVKNQIVQLFQQFYPLRTNIFGIELI